MKAITVIQPWATLLATGKKRIETRSWRTNYRGEILIHAGKKDFTKHLIQDSRSFMEYLSRAGIYWGLKLPTGAIIGKANLVNCLQIDELTEALIKEQHPDEYEFGDFTPGRFAWVMTDPVLFEKPILVSGKQGLWNWEVE